jgi:D-amino-acid dehydrogenase
VASGPVGPVVVVGGGIVGLSCAWFLRHAGADVTVLEAGSRVGGGASRGNAGAICPSLCEPLPAPGTIRRALADMRRPDAALHVHPRYAPRMASFLARFTAAASSDAYERGLRALAGLARDVVPSYEELAAGGVGGYVRRDGYLFAHTDEDAAAHEHRFVERMAELELCAPPEPVVGGGELRAREPLLTQDVRAGFVLPGERWIDPSRLVDDLDRALREAGVEVGADAGVRAVHDLGDELELESAAGVVHGGTVVLAAGAWTRELCAGLGLRLPLLPGKGYSFALRPGRMPSRALFFSDPHVVASPMGERLRIAGTMEFDGTMDRFNRRRVDAIVRGLGRVLTGVDLGARTEEWVGPRPMTPDGLPLIGPVPRHPRVLVASGHNMLGVTLAAATGRAVAGSVLRGDPGVDLAPFAPDRFA